MRKILIIKCGDTFSEVKNIYGDFEDWIIKQTQLPGQVFKIFDLPKGDSLQHPGEYIAAIITGSHYNINQRLPWIKHLKDWLVTARYTNLPVLGICFGHQVIAETLGGKVIRIETGRNIGKLTIKVDGNHTKNPLFKGTGGEFESYVSHGWIINDPIPGNDTEIIARDLKGNIMAIMSGKIYGVQFHPEFSEGIMKMYLKEAKMPTSHLLGVKLRSEHKNQSIISNFVDEIIKI
ncbi:MAG: gamma-glutamyl-gamma-aminobutyrate hydrolase family protein [Prolixibacteraceae bacterium]|nr:gamma-glutamyl-gamma-aminobutyrate hydrolase family protein [Prolixibacteraceae bacterium]